MADVLETLAARIARLDAAVARGAGPGSAFDRGVEAVSRSIRTTARDARRLAGARLPAAASREAAGLGRVVIEVARLARREPTGLLGLAIVGALSLALTSLLWDVLAYPSGVVNQFVAIVTPTTCAGFGSENLVTDNLCGSVLGLLTVAGALAAMGGMLLVRWPLRRAIGGTFGLLPRDVAFIGPPVLAALVFTMGWAGVQYHFRARPGIVSDGTFPALVGVLAYAIQRYGPLVQPSLGPLLDARERLSRWQRAAAMVVAPLAFALLATPLLSTPVRDQATVIAGILLGYVLFAPRVAPAAAVEDGERTP